VGEEMMGYSNRFIAPFNGPIEIGLRAISILNDVYPSGYSLQRLIIFDYLSVHSDDISGGPSGLHPKTPHRSGELLVRRDALQKGLLLYMGRGLAEQRFEMSGVTYAATERTGAFLDVLETEYVSDLRQRTCWLVDTFDAASDDELNSLVQQNLGAWGAEFEMESVLWMEDEI
jgi:hypothetical protein